MANWTIKSALNFCQDYLARHGDNNPRLSSQWLLSNAVGCSKIDLYVNFDKPLCKDELDTLRETLKQRAVGRPLQYIVGQTRFRNIDIFCEEGVLIPRPETEVLVDVVLNEIENCSLDQLRIIDIGCGTGCIACSLCSENQKIKVDAVDVSNAALNLTRKNVDALGLTDKINVTNMDITVSLHVPKPYDVIVSNPPYIPSNLIESLDREVKDFEPISALDGGVNGLDYFKSILRFAENNLVNKGFFAVELFEDSLGDAIEYAEELRFTRCRIENDLAGRPRILVGYKR